MAGEMMEKVARAVSEHMGVNLAFTEPMDSDTPTIAECRIADTERALKIARAAIEAMLVPTEEMDLAGVHAEKFRSLGLLKVHGIWGAMIDAALKD